MKYHFVVTANRLVDILVKPDHAFHQRAKNFMLNDGTQKIAEDVLEFKWIYSPQSLWVYRPKYVLFYEDLEREWNAFNRLHNLSKPALPVTHATRKKTHEPLSPKTKRFIENFYKDDMEIVAEFRKIPLEERIQGLVYPS